MEVETSDVDLQTVVADFRAGDPVAHLRIGLEQLPFDPAAVGPEQAAETTNAEAAGAIVLARGNLSSLRRPARPVTLRRTTTLHAMRAHRPDWNGSPL